MSKLGSLETMIEDMEHGVYDFTVDGECSGCGNCCSNILPVSSREIRVIEKYIRKKHIKAQVRWAPTAVPTVDMICPFRDEKNSRCTIYEVRPAICREFRCDKPRKHIEFNREKYDERFGVIDVRATFFPKERKI